MFCLCCTFWINAASSSLLSPLPRETFNQHKRHFEIFLLTVCSCMLQKNFQAADSANVTLWSWQEMVCYLDVNIPQEHFTFRFCGFAVTSDSQLLYPLTKRLLHSCAPLICLHAKQINSFVLFLHWTACSAASLLENKQTVHALEMWNGYILVWDMSPQCLSLAHSQTPYDKINLLFLCGKANLMAGGIRNAVCCSLDKVLISLSSPLCYQHFTVTLHQTASNLSHLQWWKNHLLLIMSVLYETVIASQLIKELNVWLNK